MGLIRVPGPGSLDAGAEDRTVMAGPSGLAGRTKLPVKVAPASSWITSPGAARSRAA